MAQLIGIVRLLLLAGALVVGTIVVLPETAPAQEEVTSAIRRYKQYEVSTGYYEEFEARPQYQRPLIGVPGLRQGVFPYSTTSARVRIRTRLSDSHQGIKFYNGRRCEDCHVNETRDIHTTRANLTCRQCHGGEPVASIDHYYSPMNPIRRHAYICAKCHEGSNASFASYIIHEPAAGSSIARTTFPVLYYAYWFMLVLLVGTLAFFIPHSLLVGLRELFKIKRKTKNADSDAH
jgi:hypothetical protein